MIETLRTLRQSTGRALLTVLKEHSASDHPSEVQLRDAWHQQLADIPAFAQDGWYAPPPKGIIVAIGNPPNYEHVDQPTFRTEHTWPTGDRCLNVESLLFAYASPVHTDTGFIGDLGCTLYRGTNRRLWSHLHAVWDVTMEIANMATAGMTLGDLHGRAHKLITRSGFRNEVFSRSDRNLTNIGHTIPWTHEAMSDKERHILQKGTAEQRAALISSKRKFVTADETLEISDAFAFTIEPRLSTQNLPTAYFHTLVAFEAGRKQIITELDPLLKHFEMHEFHRI